MKAAYKINQDFFKEWSSNMAYILGFTCADGCLYGRTLSWELSNKYLSDRDILINFNKVMSSNYPVKNRHSSFRLRISNPEILKDIQQLGVVQNKTKILKFPIVPRGLISHFLRGFLDADGWIIATIKAKGTKEISVGFVNGSLDFMKALSDKIKEYIGIKNLHLRTHEKISKEGIVSNYYSLEFYSDNAYKIIQFIYDGLTKDDIFLKRKFEKQLLAREFYNQTRSIKLYGRYWLDVEQKNNISMGALLNKLLNEGYIPRQIAIYFGVSLSTLYRWLDKSRVRLLESRGSQEWIRKVLSTRRQLKYGRV